MGISALGRGWHSPARGSWLSYAAVAVAVAAVLALLFVPGLLAKGPPPEPAQWRPVESATKALSLQVPANWRVSCSGSSGTYDRVRVKAARLATITIYGSQTLGAMGDISGAAVRTLTGLPLSKRAEGRLHTKLGELVKKTDPTYKELGQMQPCTIGGLPGAYSVYQAVRRVGLVPITVKGWRITVPVGDFSFDIRAECPSQHWTAFQPAVARLLSSIAFSRR